MAQASLFTDRAICYREEREFDHMDVALSIAVQKMVRSDKACSGVAFTIDTETGYNKVVLITGNWGLGENVVQGTVTPDEFIVFKDTLKKGARPIVSRKLGYWGSLKFVPHFYARLTLPLVRAGPRR